MTITINATAVHAHDSLVQVHVSTEQVHGSTAQIHVSMAQVHVSTAQVHGPSAMPSFVVALNYLITSKLTQLPVVKNCLAFHVN